jgi:hypothetical protein
MSIAIQKLYSNLELVKESGNNGRESIKEQHTWEAKAKYYISLHETII